MTSLAAAPRAGSYLTPLAASLSAGRGGTLRRLLGALLLIVAAPASAWAHGTLRASSPSGGAHLATAPTSIRLSFTESPELTFTSVRLVGPNGADVALAPLAVAPDSRRAVVAAVRGAIAAGVYTVVWQMAGADGHPVRGTFTFTVAQGTMGMAAGTEMAGGHENAVSQPGGPGFGAESPAYVAIRWLQYGALLVILGAVAFQGVVLGFLRRVQHPDSPMVPDARRGAARLALRATAALAVTALLRLYAQSYALHGAGRAFDAGLVGAMLTRTVWGRGWLLELFGLVVAALAFARARHGSNRSGAAWALAALGAVALAVVPALTGHAASAPRLTPLAILADTLHVIGAGGWLGSLLLVLAAGVPAARRLPEAERWPAVAALVNAFSPTALVFSGIVAATGLFATWLHVGTVPALWQTAYGRTLLLKLAVLSVVAGTGAYNWLRVKPALGGEEGTRLLKRSAAVELGVAVVVLLITAVLVATPTAMDLQAMR